MCVGVHIPMCVCMYVVRVCVCKYTDLTNCCAHTQKILNVYLSANNSHIQSHTDTHACNELNNYIAKKRNTCVCVCR